MARDKGSTSAKPDPLHSAFVALITAVTGTILPFPIPASARAVEIQPELLCLLGFMQLSALKPLLVTGIILAIVAIVLLAVYLALVGPELRRAALSEKRFRDISRRSLDWIWETDPQGHLLYSSDSIQQLLGYSPDSLLGKTRLELVHPEDREYVAATYRVGAERLAPIQDHEHRLRTINGAQVYVLSSCVPLLDEHQKLAGWRGIDKNITERKLAERELYKLNAELEQRVRQRTAELADANELLREEIIVRSVAEEQAQQMALFTELNPTPVLRFDTEGIITMANPAAGDVFGNPGVEGQPLAKLLPELADLDLTACIARGENHAITSSHDDKTFTFSVRGVPELGFGQVYATDVTELVAARVQAEAANRAKSQFLTNMSHELRTPLTVINGFSEVLLEMGEDNFSERQMVYLERIKKNGEHLLVLINDLLDLAKIEAGRLELEFRSMDIAGIMREAGDLMLPNVTRRGLSLQKELPDVAVLINGDPLRLKQTVLNLLSNAIKFTREGSVTLWLVDYEQHVELGVRDTGIGIALEHQRRLFKPFEQVHDKLKVAEQGTGLGLALCQEIVDAHGGTISVESEINVGSDFKVTLPKEAAPA